MLPVRRKGHQPVKTQKGYGHEDQKAKKGLQEVQGVMANGGWEQGGEGGVRWEVGRGGESLDGWNGDLVPG